MPLTVTPNEDAVITALRAFLLDVVASDFEVVKAQDNRVPEPRSANFVLVTPVRRMRLATNVDLDLDTAGNLAKVVQATQFDYQLDIHGPDSGDACQIVSTMTRDGYASDFFSINSPGVSPLYANDPRQMPFTNAQQQYEDRWIIEVSLQADPAIVFPQQYADVLYIGLVEVDTFIPAPPSGDASLDFSDPDNSQYAPAL